ncbi:hypothetical protein AAE478_009758 [Parahypoxylon ruwenzoriense]
MDVPGFALVTGAASGIGKACAEAFAYEGASGVALLDINHEALISTQAEIQAKYDQRKDEIPGFRILVYALDVTDEQQVDETVQAAAKEFGRLDYVVNAAGITMKHKGGAAFAETEDWKRVVDVNLTGSFFILRAAAKIMLQQEPIRSSIHGGPVQRGSIVLFSSIVGMVGVPMSTAYAAAKHGVLGLMRTASEDYAKNGLRINAVCPGYTETPMTTKNPLVLEEMVEYVRTAVPMERRGKPQEIADGVLFLAGGRSSFVTGTALPIDGGYTQR